MRRVKTMLVLAAALLLAVAPSWSTCPFSSPFTQGGGGGRPAGAIVGSAGPIGGFWWEVGMGDPALGSGNDSGVLEVPEPTSDADWILRTLGPFADETGVIWDWLFPGSDGCLSGGAGSGAMAVYLLDAGGQFAVMAVQGTTVPDLRHDFDTITNGVGPDGNDVQMEPLGLAPELVISSMTDTDFVADVLPAADSLNCYDDASGLCQDGSVATVFATQLLAEDGGGGLTPVAGCDAGGCLGVTLLRDVPYCWDAGAEILAAPGLPIGPAIPGGCVVVVSNDVALNARFERDRGSRVFLWEAATFNVTGFDVVGTKRGVDVFLNPALIPVKANDGSLQSYRFAVRNSQIKGAKQLRVRTHLNDGTFNETPIER